MLGGAQETCTAAKQADRRATVIGRYFTCGKVPYNRPRTTDLARAFPRTNWVARPDLDEWGGRDGRRDHNGLIR